MAGVRGVAGVGGVVGGVFTCEEYIYKWLMW